MTTIAPNATELVDKTALRAIVALVQEDFWSKKCIIDLGGITMANCTVCGRYYNCADAYLYEGCSDCIKQYEQEHLEEARQLDIDPAYFGFNEWRECAKIKLREASGEIPHKVAVDQIKNLIQIVKQNHEKAEAMRKLKQQAADERRAALSKINIKDYYS